MRTALKATNRFQSEPLQPAHTTIYIELAVYYIHVAKTNAVYNNSPAMNTPIMKVIMFGFYQKDFCFVVDYTV